MSSQVTTNCSDGKSEFPKHRRCVLPDICRLVLESSVGDACCIIQVMGTSTDLSGVIQLLVRWILNS